MNDESTLTGKVVGSLFVEAFQSSLDKYPSRKSRDHWSRLGVGLYSFL